MAGKGGASAVKVAAGWSAKASAWADRLAGCRSDPDAAVFSRRPQQQHRCSSSAFQVWQYRQFIHSPARDRAQLCYVARLGPFARHSSFCLNSTLTPVCHGFFFSAKIFLALIFAVCLLRAQTGDAPKATPPAPVANAAPDFSLKAPPNAPPQGFWDVGYDKADNQGSKHHLIGHAKIVGADVLLTADDIEDDEDTGEVKAKGNVVFHQYTHDEELHADRVEYNTRNETGKFYNVRGWSRTQVISKPNALTSSTPLYFEAEWAERVEDKYILHHGMITNCKLPNPWWTLRGARFDIVQDDYATAHRGVFRLKGMPLLYMPYFYKSLARVPRQSGFLSPTIGHSSLGTGGYFVGIGYYWAINRSYDATYNILDYTAGAVSHNVEFRGKPSARADFDAIVLGVQNTGLLVGGLKAEGYDITARGRAALGDGFYAGGALDYLSSLAFRETFTQSFNEAAFSDSASVGFVGKDWSSFSFDTVFSRLESFQSATPVQVTVGSHTTTEADAIFIRKLPEVDFSSRDRQIWQNLPIWVSFDSSEGLLDRSDPPVTGQPTFQTALITERTDFSPHVMTTFDWKGFHIVPGFSLEETNYTVSQANQELVEHGLNRFSRDVDVDLIFPTLERVFNRKTVFGEKLKHVIEPRVSYRYVSGVQNFNEVVRFDSTDVVSNTDQVELSLTNRVYTKRGKDIWELFTWQLWEQFYLDPTFGGAVLPGQRNVVLSSIELTPFAFLNGPRSYSPLVSAISVSPKPGWRLEWRTDYDPYVKKIVDSLFFADFRKGNFFFSPGYNLVTCRPLTPADAAQCKSPNPDTTRLLSPQGNQLHGRAGWGDPNHRGWNAGFDTAYDYRTGTLQYGTFQVTYNTDCCGLSAQYRVYNLGIIQNKAQWGFAFTVANFGSAGNLRKQQRMF
ncbi:MAG TPA: LPS assembly protein LptD [Bryobacteraceae bacterium]|nr:LPS assembly protein LptD [Bryobacteraceae bacterium]